MNVSPKIRYLTYAGTTARLMRVFVLSVFWVSFGLSPAIGQITTDSLTDRLPLADNIHVQALQTDFSATLNEVKAAQAWQTYAHTDTIIPEKELWLKFEVKNPSKDTVQAYLYSFVDRVVIYQQNGQGSQAVRNGDYMPLGQRANQSEFFFTNLRFPPLTTQVYIRLQTIDSWGPIMLFSEKGYLELSKDIYNDQIKSIVFIYFYIFSLFTVFMFILVLWLRVRGRLYFYYLGYLFFLIVYGFIVLRETIAPVGNFFHYAPELAEALNDPVQFVFIAFYIFFILTLLQVKVFDKRLAWTLKALGIVCLVYAISRAFYNLFFYQDTFGTALYNTVRLIILPINFVLIFWIIFKVKHRLLGYFIIGQSLFFIGAVLATYIHYADLEFVSGHFFGFKEAANVVFQLGLISEVYCFSLALGKNVYLIQEEKEQTGAALIRQFQENERLQTNMNRELDIKVHEKTTELIQLYAEIEKEREEKIKSEFTKKIRETEMIALRSQMNPHFIFNSMNAIKYLIMTSRNADAMAYLDNFSSLLRHILQSSGQKEITVEEELEILELYLSLEQSRMGSGFSYHIKFTSKDILSQYQIPPLLLQPIVENAIWHGLHPSLKSEKVLMITFDTSDNLKIIIEDNGVGRDESAKKEKLHTAMGTSLIRDRLALHNHLSDDAIRLEITDLKRDGRGLGTRVTLTYTMEQ